MPVFLPTTRISILDPVGSEPYEPADPPQPQATGIRAHLSSPSGLERLAGGSLEQVDKRLLCDPTPLVHDQLVRDEGTGDTYTVVWVDQRVGLGLDHTVAGLRRFRGEN